MNEENQGKKSKKKVLTLIAAIVLILIAALVVFWFNSQIRATTMRILRMEGVVSLEDNGKKKTATDNLRLKSGNALSTDVKSLVSIGLDDTKIVTLDEKSRAEFNQKGRKLDLKLTDGSLFFEVQKPLAADESFDIKTSTMVVGIRGTSGWVSVDGEHEQLIVTDGKVHVIGTNPTTGEVKEIDVKAGQRITVYLYNDRTVDSIEFMLEEVTERELPEFLLNRLRENPELLDKVCRETGWDKPWILGQVRDEMPVVKIDDVPPDDGPDDDNDGGDSLSEEELEDESALDPDIDPAHPRGARWSERRAARKRIIFTDVNSGIVALDDGTLFDPAFYAATNPDVVADYGTDTDALLAHWLKIGKREGRPPIAPRTPTPTPIWMVQPVDGGGDDDGDYSHEDHRAKSSTNQAVNQVVLTSPTAGNLTFSPGGATATATYSTPGQAGGVWELSITSPDSGSTNTATLPTSYTVEDQWNGKKSYGISIDPNSRNVSLANNNITTLDLSAATATTGGNVYGEDMSTFMDNNNQLTTLVGPGSTLTKTGNNPRNTYTASVNTGLSQALTDLHDYLNNMGTGQGKNGVTRTEFEHVKNTQNPDLIVEYDSNMSKTKVSFDGGTTYYYGVTMENITWGQTSYEIKDEGGAHLGTVTSAGFTRP